MEFDFGKYQELVEQTEINFFQNIKTHLSGRDYDLVKLAHSVSNHAHYPQKRKSGEPYITHPIEVATIISNWGLDASAIASALLHDVIEDTNVSKEDIAQIFGTEIAEIVDGLTKLEKLHFESEEVAHAEYFRKVVLAMAKDIRVIIIKLADRFHNMLTLSSMSSEKRKRIAIETLEIYVPIANRIGLHKIYLELANECFKYIHPLRYQILTKALNDSQSKRLPIIENIIHNLKNGLRSNGISTKFIHKPLTVFNLYQRMATRRQSFNRIQNLFEIKIIVNTIRDCYLTIGVLHSMYQPIPLKFKDYIAIPKSNGYQSLHSTMMGPNGIPIEIHVLTETMEQIAENGIISHRLTQNQDMEFVSANQRTSNWINNILDIQSSSFSANEFLESIKQDLSPKDIYVFTPKGKIILLPQGSTSIDFAYAIHTDIGQHCSKAYVNQKLVKLNLPLQNGDIIKIITKESVEPQEGWLKMAVSGRAISKIKQYIKEQKFDEDANTGRELINLCLNLFGTKIIFDDKILEMLCLRFPKMDKADIIHSIGIGKIPALEITKYILGYLKHETISIKLSYCLQNDSNKIILVQDTECLPLPGDKVFAKITKQKELLLHSLNCKQNKNIGLDNLTLVHIINDIGKVFLAKIHVLISNNLGTFTKFTAIIAEHKINIVELNQEVHTKESALINATLGVHDRSEINELVVVLSKANFIKKITLL